MANLENRPDFEQISQLKPTKKMTPGEIRQKLHEDDSETDEAKPMSFPAESKIPGAKKLDKVGMDKAEQFRLQDEIDKMQGEMEKQIEIISKLWARDQDQSKANKQKEKIKEKFEPRIAELQNKLKEEFGEKESIETLMPQLKKQTEKSDAKRAARKKEEADIGSRFQRIPVTPELEAAQKKAAQRDMENAHAKLAKAEENFAEAKKNRPNVISRFFSRFKIGKQPEAIIAYQQAFQDKNVSPEELKKLEAAAVEASTSKSSAAEMAYQQAVRAVSEAKNQLEETENAILDSGIYMKPKKREPGEEVEKKITIGTSGMGDSRVSVRGIIQKEKPKAEVQKPEKPIARKPAIITGEHKIIFKQEPTPAQRKVEVKLPPEQKFAPEVVSEAEEQLENYIKGMFFKGDNTKQLIFQNAALMDRLMDTNFQGEQQTLNQAIIDTKEEMLKTHKLNLEKQLKLEGAKFDDLADGGKLATQLKAIFKKQPENYNQFLALEDLFEANETAAGRAPKRPARPAAPIFRNY